MNSRLKSLQAFTLIEVLIAVAIVSTLASVVGPTSIRARLKANDAVAKTYLRTIGMALENYQAENYRYPDTTEDLLNVTSSYLNQNYFSGTHRGFVYQADLSPFEYQITASPVKIGKSGSTTYTIETGGVITE